MAMPEATTTEPSKLRCRCPDCGCTMWAERRDQWTLKTAILKLVDGRLFAVCPEGGCRGQVWVPWLALVEPPPKRLSRRVVIRVHADLDNATVPGSE